MDVLDTKVYVTVGVGCMLPGAPQACALPFEKKDLPEEIAADFARVSAMQKGLRPATYRGDIILTDTAIDAELLRRLTVVDRALPAIFRGYAQYPDSCKLDMGTTSEFMDWPASSRASRSPQTQEIIKQRKLSV